MMKKIMTCFNSCMLVCLLMAACKKENTATTGADCKLTSITTDSTKLELTYNTAGDVAGANFFNNGNALDHYTYTYNTGQIVEQDYSPTNTLTGTVTYTLGTNGYPVSSVGIYTGRTDSSFYTYNNDGYLTASRTESYTIVNGAPAWLITKTVAYTIENGNKVKEVINEVIAEGNATTEFTYEYYTTQADYAGLYSDVNFLGKPNSSLLKKVNGKFNNNEVTTTSYTYEFDSEEKPTKAIQTNTKQSGTFTRTFLYQFQCN